jgi:hypothetical protein
MNGRARGHSLVEAIVAAAIAGAVLVATSALFAQAGEVIAQARCATRAVLLARGLLEESLGHPAAALLAAGFRDVLVPDLPSGRARTQFVALGAPGLADPPVRIAVSVLWMHRGRERRVTLRTVRF